LILSAKTPYFAGLALLAAVTAAHSDDYISGPMGSIRVQAIARQAEPPGPLSKPYVELLDVVSGAILHSTQDVAVDRWTAFLQRQREAGRKGVPSGYLDYILRRVTIEVSPAASSAGERIAYWAAQEAAVLEHLSLLEKHNADRAGSRLPDFVLREPVLGKFGDNPEPVRPGLPENVNTGELPQRIAAWRETLDTLTRRRTGTEREFDAAVRADAELLERLSEADRRLTETARALFAQPQP
jgi:hypothetical protein